MTPPRNAAAAAAQPDPDDEPVDAVIIEDDATTGVANLPVPAPLPRPAGLSLVADDPWALEETGDLAPFEASGNVPYLDFNAKYGGGFIDPETNEKTLSLSFVWLLRSVSRAWWSKPFGDKDASKTPDCRSIDGLVPTENSPDKQSEACATCKWAQWDGGTPPPCKASMEAMALVLGGEDDTVSGFEYGNLVRIRFGGLGYSPARSYYASFTKHVPKRPAWSVVTNVTLEEVDKPPNGVFLVPHFERGEALPHEVAGALRAMQAEHKAEWQQAVADDVATGRGVESTPAGDEGDPFAPPGGVPESERPFDDSDRLLRDSEF